MADNDSSRPRVLSEFLHPIVVVALLIVLSVIALIAAAVLGVDKGVLRSMGTTQYARGLITYLFAVVTIGTAVVIILAGLMGPDNPETEKRFQRGKEILSLLLGVFGTIVGYYFGADAGTQRALILQVSPIHVAPMAGKPGYVTVEAFVAAGSPPYSYGLGVDSGAIPANKPVPEDGWIVAQFQIGSAAGTLRLVVQDAAGQTVEKTVSVNGGTP